jgi:dTDP-4-dehydrorhamnose 3,5-epimerase
MLLSPTEIKGLTIIDPEFHEDERGSFARTFCEQEFAASGIDFRVAQVNLSRNRNRHTLRGLHYQVAPHEEAKVVSCVRGRIFDVAVDLRPGSATYRRWVGVELSATTGRALYLPKGFAHGFLSLEPDTEVHYLMGSPYVPGAARGLRWDDAALGIDWPATPGTISERDRSYPLIS